MKTLPKAVGGPLVSSISMEVAINSIKYEAASGSSFMAKSHTIKFVTAAVQTAVAAAGALAVYSLASGTSSLVVATVVGLK
jgi:hypothetical protein